MTSQIAFTSIDSGFPVAGIDNNSQGFRDNFSLIKDGLSTASSEITILQNNTAKNNADNDFNGVIIENAEVRRLYGSVEPWSLQSTNFNLDNRLADYHTVTIGGALVISFTNWPGPDLYRVFRVSIKSNGTSYTVGFGGGAMRKDNLFPVVFNTGTNQNTTFVIEVSSSDGGNEIFLKYLGEFN